MSEAMPERDWKCMTKYPNLFKNKDLAGEMKYWEIDCRDPADQEETAAGNRDCS